MTAQEMFEELEFKLTSKNLEYGSIVYVKGIHALIFDDSKYSYYKCVNPKLHKAIHQQMIELGWLKC